MPDRSLPGAFGTAREACMPYRLLQGGKINLKRR
jgi:hypothetical protein